jgi:hypothetical protein
MEKILLVILRNNFYYFLFKYNLLFKASQSRDMIHTISRYYSNAFADADKQNAMNIFLGVFEPSKYNFNIFDLEKDGLI